MTVKSDPAADARERIQTGTARVAVMGLGYAGLPMAVEIAAAGLTVTGIDVDDARVDAVSRGESPVTNVASSDVAQLAASDRLSATTDFAKLASADVVLIAVPTPLWADGRPNTGYIESAVAEIARYAHPGQLIILQSTCAPGTTRRLVADVLSRAGHIIGEDVFVCFAPERIDPGNTQFQVGNTPKLVGGVTPRCSDLGVALFNRFIEKVIPVRSPEVAEMAKLVENTFRFINIGFVNELAIFCDHIGVNVWEVIDAAASKPFAFMPHWPGPGVGGHCIPVVPFYLSAVAREHGMHFQFIDTAAAINDRMSVWLVDRYERALGDQGRSLKDGPTLLLGVAYKADIDDVRETPAGPIIREFRRRGADFLYHDPFVPSLTVDGGQLQSVDLDPALLSRCNGVVLVTPHTSVDYGAVLAHSRLVFDARNHLAQSGAPNLEIL